MKTLHELLKEHSNLNQSLDGLKKQTLELQAKKVEVKEEILKNFAPKDLIGLECNIDVKEWSFNENRPTYNILISEGIFLAEAINGGYRKEMKGRKCKIISVDLFDVNADQSISWSLTAVAAKANGEYGALTIRSVIIDKSHLSD